MIRPILLLLFVFFISASAAEKQQPVSTDSLVKLNTAVMDLEPRGGISASEIQSLSDRLRGELIETSHFVVLERSQMDQILKEQGFQQTGVCSEASCIVEVGQLLAVHKMVGGSIGVVGKAYSINVKVIDVTTGKIERQFSMDVKCSKEELVKVHMRRMARLMAGLEKESPPLTSKWYFWGGIGLLAAGSGAVAVYYLTATDPAPAGADTPPSDTRRQLPIEVPLQ